MTPAPDDRPPTTAEQLELQRREYLETTDPAERAVIAETGRALRVLYDEGL